MNIYRIAAFFAPAFEHPLWTAGCEWLGRDARGDYGSQAQGLDPLRDSMLTEAARRYGFHGTLKPPFVPVSDDAPDKILQTTKSLLAQMPTFEMPALSVQILDGFLALRPAGHDDPALLALNELAETLVRGLDPFRPPASAQQIKQRATGFAGLTAKQLAMLEQWGYPFVLDTWRFHMTLTRRLDRPGDRPERALAAAREHFAPALDQSLQCADVCLFVEPAPASDFVCWQRVPLGASGC